MGELRADIGAVLASDPSADARLEQRVAASTDPLRPSLVVLRNAVAEHKSRTSATVAHLAGVPQLLMRLRTIPVSILGWVPLLSCIVERWNVSCSWMIPNLCGFASVSSNPSCQRTCERRQATLPMRWYVCGGV